MDAISHFIRQGFRDIHVSLPWYLWYPALFYVGIIFAVLFALRPLNSYRGIWTKALVIFLVGSVLTWRLMVGTGDGSRGASGPEMMPNLLLVAILFLIVLPLLMACSPLLILATLIPPRGIDRRVRIAACVGAITLAVALYISMFNKAAERREQYLKAHPDATRYMIVE